MVMWRGWWSMVLTGERSIIKTGCGLFVVWAGGVSLGFGIGLRIWFWVNRNNIDPFGLLAYKSQGPILLKLKIPRTEFVISPKVV